MLNIFSIKRRKQNQILATYHPWEMYHITRLTPKALFLPKDGISYIYQPTRRADKRFATFFISRTQLPAIQAAFKMSAWSREPAGMWLRMCVWHSSILLSEISYSASILRTPFGSALLKFTDAWSWVLNLIYPLSVSTSNWRVDNIEKSMKRRTNVLTPNAINLKDADLASGRVAQKCFTWPSSSQIPIFWSDLKNQIKFKSSWPEGFAVQTSTSAQ